MSIVQEKMYMDVDDVWAILGVSKAYAYNLMREYNKELKANDQMYMYRQSPRADERVTSTEANAVVKDAGKADRKPEQQKQAMEGKEKKPSIHERLEINKRIIQEKQGKDKPERGADRGVR